MNLNERYRAGRFLEHGPLGDLFLAEDLTTGSTVVIRALERHFEIAPDVLEAFQQDAAKLRALGLPTIAPALDLFWHEGSLHLVSPFLDGPTLEQVLAEHGPLDPRTFQAWATSLTRTLIDAHVEEVIHGDLRPSCIFVVPKDPGEKDTPAHPADSLPDVRLVIADFGLYRLFEGMRLSTTTARLSLSNYTSPQRWQGQRVRIDDDIWSLGVLFFTMVSGRKPFDAPSDAAQNHAARAVLGDAQPARARPARHGGDHRALPGEGPLAALPQSARLADRSGAGQRALAGPPLRPDAAAPPPAVGFVGHLHDVPGFSRPTSRRAEGRPTWPAISRP